MEEWITGVIFALFIIIPCWLALARRKNGQRQVEAWSELARLTGLTLNAKTYRDPKGIYHYPSIHGKYRSRSLTMKPIVYDFDNPFYPPNSATISLKVQNCLEFSLAVQAKSFHKFIHKITEVSSGDWGFDSRFSVTGSPPEYLQAAVDRIVRSDSHLFAWMMRAFPAIELKGDRLLCHQNGELTNVDSQIALLNLLCDLAELAEEMEKDNVKRNGVGREIWLTHLSMAKVRRNGMHTKTHAILMKYSPVTPFILFPFSVVASCLLTDLHLLPGIVIVFFLLVFFMWYVFPYFPVWCDTAGCGGRVHRNSTRISYMTVRLHYICQICGDVYEVDIFAPEDDVRIGG